MRHAKAVTPYEAPAFCSRVVESAAGRSVFSRQMRLPASLPATYSEDSQSRPIPASLLPEPYRAVDSTLGLLHCSRQTTCCWRNPSSCTVCRNIRSGHHNGGQTRPTLSRFPMRIFHCWRSIRCSCCWGFVPDTELRYEKRFPFRDLESNRGANNCPLLLLERKEALKRIFRCGMTRPRRWR